MTWIFLRTLMGFSIGHLLDICRTFRGVVDVCNCLLSEKISRNLLLSMSDKKTQRKASFDSSAVHWGVPLSLQAWLGRLVCMEGMHQTGNFHEENNDKPWDGLGHPSFWDNPHVKFLGFWTPSKLLFLRPPHSPFPAWIITAVMSTTIASKKLPVMEAITNTGVRYC